MLENLSFAERMENQNKYRLAIKITQDEIDQIIEKLNAAGVAERKNYLNGSDCKRTIYLFSDSVIQHEIDFYNPENQRIILLSMSHASYRISFYTGA